MNLSDAMMLGGGAVAALGALAALVLHLRGPAPPDGSKVRAGTKGAKPMEPIGRTKHDPPLPIPEDTSVDPKERAKTLKVEK